MVLCGLDFFMRLVIVERCHSPKEWFIKPDTEAQNGNNTTQQHPSPEISTTHTNISSSCSHCGDHNDENTHTKTNDSQVTVRKLLRRPRLLVSLHITLVVAAVMSSFEVKTCHLIYIGSYSHSKRALLASDFSQHCRCALLPSGILTKLLSVLFF